MAVAARGEMLRLEGIRAELWWFARRAARPRGIGARKSNRATSKKPGNFASAIGTLSNRTLRRLLRRQLPRQPANPRQASSHRRLHQSRPDPVRLRAPRTAFNKKLHQWLHKPCNRHLAAFDRTASGGFTTETRSAIAWLETLVFSARTKWMNGKKTIHLRYRLPSAKINFWCFLDASRSTGRPRFLDAARDAIARLARSTKFARFHLLVLKKGEIRWLANSSTFHRFEAALFRLSEASGKSLHR